MQKSQKAKEQAKESYDTYYSYADALALMVEEVSFFAQYYARHPQLVQGAFRKIEKTKVDVNKLGAKMENSGDPMEFITQYQQVQLTYIQTKGDIHKFIGFLATTRTCLSWPSRE
eukprot:Gb_19892 [translate_table: standard]